MYLCFYTWLWDAFARKFNNSSLQKYLWKHMSQFTRLSSIPRHVNLLTYNGNGDDGRPSSCKTCGSNTIHLKISPLSLWNTCLFASSENNKRIARIAQGLVNKHMQENRLESTTMEDVLQKIEEARNSSKRPLKCFIISCYLFQRGTFYWHQFSTQTPRALSLKLKHPQTSPMSSSSKFS